MSLWEFEIVTIQKTLPPIPGHKGQWYRYTIANRTTEITGTRKGSREEVSAFVNTALKRLNSRHKATAFAKA